MPRTTLIEGDGPLAGQTTDAINHCSSPQGVLGQGLDKCYPEGDGGCVDRGLTNDLGSQLWSLDKRA